MGKEALSFQVYAFLNSKKKFFVWMTFFSVILTFSSVGFGLGYGTKTNSTSIPTAPLKEIPKDKIKLAACKNLTIPIYNEFDTWTSNTICDPSFRSRSTNNLSGIAKAAHYVGRGQDPNKEIMTKDFLVLLRGRAEINLRYEITRMKMAQECLKDSSKCNEESNKYLQEVRSGVSKNWDSMQESAALGFTSNPLTGDLTQNSNADSPWNFKSKGKPQTSIWVKPEISHPFDSRIGKLTSENSYKPISVSKEEQEKIKSSYNKSLEKYRLQWEYLCSKDFKVESLKGTEYETDPEKYFPKPDRNQNPCPQKIGKDHLYYDHQVESYVREKIKGELIEGHQKNYYEKMAASPIMAFINPADPQNIDDKELLSAFEQLQRNAEGTRQLMSEQDNYELANYIPLIEQIAADDPNMCGVAEGFLASAEKEQKLDEAKMIAIGVAASAPCILAGPGATIACFAIGGVGVTAYGGYEAIQNRKATENRSFSGAVDSKFVKDFSALSEADKNLVMETMLAPTGFGGGGAAGKALKASAKDLAIAGKSAVSKITSRGTKLAEKEVAKETPKNTTLPNGTQIKILRSFDKGNTPIESMVDELGTVSSERQNTLTAISEYLDTFPPEVANSKRVDLLKQMLTDSGLMPKDGLNQKQIDGFLYAHNEIGENRVMKITGNELNPFTKDDFQLKQKKLREAGFTEDQIDLILRNGLAGNAQSVPKLTKNNPEEFVESELAKLARGITNGDIVDKAMRAKYPPNGVATQINAEILPEFYRIATNNENATLNSREQRAFLKSLEERRKSWDEYREKKLEEQKNIQKALNRVAEKFKIPEDVASQIIVNGKISDSGVDYYRSIQRIDEQAYLALKRIGKFDPSEFYGQYGARIHAPIRQGFYPEKGGLWGLMPDKNPDRSDKGNQLFQWIMGMSSKNESIWATISARRQTAPVALKDSREAAKRPVASFSRSSTSSSRGTEELASSGSSNVTTSGYITRPLTEEERALNRSVGMSYPTSPVTSVIPENLAPWQSLLKLEADKKYLETMSNNASRKQAGEASKDITRSYAEVLSPNYPPKPKNQKDAGPPKFSELFPNKPGQPGDFIDEITRISQLGVSTDVLKRITNKAILDYRRNPNEIYAELNSRLKTVYIGNLNKLGGAPNGNNTREIFEVYRSAENLLQLQIQATQKEVGKTIRVKLSHQLKDQPQTLRELRALAQQVNALRSKLTQPPYNFTTDLIDSALIPEDLLVTPPPTPAPALNSNAN